MSDKSSGAEIVIFPGFRLNALPARTARRRKRRNMFVRALDRFDPRWIFLRRKNLAKQYVIDGFSNFRKGDRARIVDNNLSAGCQIQLCKQLATCPYVLWDRSISGPARSFSGSCRKSFAGCQPDLRQSLEDRRTKSPRPAAIRRLSCTTQASTSSFSESQTADTRSLSRWVLPVAMTAIIGPAALKNFPHRHGHNRAHNPNRARNPDCPV